MILPGNSTASHIKFTTSFDSSTRFYRLPVSKPMRKQKPVRHNLEDIVGQEQDEF